MNTNWRRCEGFADGAPAKPAHVNVCSGRRLAPYPHRIRVIRLHLRLVTDRLHLRPVVICVICGSFCLFELCLLNV
jgi:hypothetical protein